MVDISEVGKVTYKVDADFSEFDKDINDAEKKAKNSGIGEILSSGAATAGKAIGAAALAAGSAVVTIGAKATSSAVSFDQAMNQIQASTGASATEMEKYEDVMEGVYQNNYGDSFEDVANAIADVTKQLGDLNESSLQNVTESAFALRDTFGYELPESTRAAKAIMDNFGVSAEDAMGLIAAGAQNGLDYSGELLDSISEYSVQFAKIGLDADDMFKIFEQGTESGAFNLDKIGDAIKEMSIRVVDGSDTTQEGFALLGMNADEMASKFAAGGDSAQSAFQQTVEALASLEDPLAQNTAGVDLFGTMWEDLGPNVVAALAGVEEGAYNTADAMGQIKDVKYDDLGSMFDGLKRSVELLLIPLGEMLIPLLSQIIEAIMPALEAILPPITDLIGALLTPLGEIIDALLPPLIDLIEALMPIFESIIELLTPILDLFVGLLEPIANLISEAVAPLIEILGDLISTILEPIIPAIEAVANILTGVLTDAFEGLKPIVDTVIDYFEGYIEFLEGIFTGDWEKVWDGIVEMFRSAFNLIPSIAEGVINTVISVINGVIDGINDLTGSVDFLDIPKIPRIDKVSLGRLKAGLDYVPSDFYPAFLDKGEMVLTAEEASILRKAGGIQAVESGDYGINSDRPIYLNIPLTVDGREIARASAWYMGEQLSWEAR